MNVLEAKQGIEMVKKLKKWRLQGSNISLGWGDNEEETVLGSPGWGTWRKRSQGGSKSQSSCLRQRRGRNTLDFCYHPIPYQPSHWAKTAKTQQNGEPGKFSLQVQSALCSTLTRTEGQRLKLKTNVNSFGFIPGSCYLNNAMNVLECVSWCTYLRDSLWCNPGAVGHVDLIFYWKPPNYITVHLYVFYPQLCIKVLDPCP